MAFGACLNTDVFMMIFLALISAISLWKVYLLTGVGFALF
jgi:hypothetical protein